MDQHATITSSQGVTLSAGVGSNSVSLEEQRKRLEKDVRTFGKNAAEGKDALPMFAARLVSAGVAGIIGLKDPTDKSDEPDDAKKLYTIYAEEEGKKAVHEHTANGTAANVSKARKIIQFATRTIGDPQEVFNRAVVLHEEKTKGVQKHGFKPAYAAYVDVARAQIAQDTDLTDEEILAAMTKKPSKDPDVKSEVEAAQKRLDRLITGEKGIQCSDPAIIAANDSLKGFLALLGRIESLETLRDRNAELGVDVAPINRQLAELRGEPVSSTEGLEIIEPVEA